MPDLTLLKQKTAELLGEGQRTGALSLVEYERRTFDLELAQTVDAIEAVVRDLVDDASSHGTASTSPNEVMELSHQRSQLTIMSERHLNALNLGSKTDSLTVMGQTFIDLTGLSSDTPVKLEVLVVMGETVIQVPEGLTIQLDSLPIMGDCSIAPQVRVARSEVRINALVIMGSVRVVSKKKS